jgi:hypothetical protein
MNTRNALKGALAAVCVAAFATGCFKNVTASGKSFNYDNHEKIVKGQTTRDEVHALLEGEPTNTGSSGDLTFEVYQYSETESSSSYIPNMPGSSRSESAISSWEVTVYYNENNVVANKNFSKTGTGSSSRQKAKTKDELKSDSADRKADMKSDSAEQKSAMDEK